MCFQLECTKHRESHSNSGRGGEVSAQYNDPLHPRRRFSESSDAVWGPSLESVSAGKINLEWMSLAYHSNINFKSSATGN